MTLIKSSSQKTNYSESIVKKNSVWEGNNFIQFQVSKIIKKKGKTWVYYHVKDNPKQTYFCYEEAFLQRFHLLINLY